MVGGSKKPKARSLDFFGKRIEDFSKRTKQPKALIRPRLQRNLRASAFGHVQEALCLIGEIGGKKNPLVKQHLGRIMQADMHAFVEWITELGKIRAYYRAYSRRGAKGVSQQDAKEVYALAQKVIRISKMPEKQGNQLPDWKKRAAKDED